MVQEITLGHTISLACNYPHLLEEPKYTGEKFGSKSFCVAGPRFWNRLPAELRENSSLDTFKKYLKTYLFRKHYHTEN